MATISNNDIARAIYLVSKDKKNEELPDFYKNVIQFLFKKRLLTKSDDLLRKLEKVMNREENKILVKVSSTKKITEKIKKEVTELLKKKYEAREVILEEVLDQKLLGGIKLEVNNEIIDLSLRNKINKLQEHLIRKI